MQYWLIFLIDTMCIFFRNCFILVVVNSSSCFYLPLSIKFLFHFQRQITENDIIHSIQLTSVTGGGRIADADNIATITVSSNDDPIGFLVTDTFRLGNEGDVVTLQVIRGGDVGGMATATFNVTYQTASSDDVIIIPTNGIVVFEDGMTSVDINITLLDDVKPELNENLLLTLISTTG